tara:strand:+ start:2356 stop:2688 length:333 start_codon:yes stop_codon:yes gene_type:complete
MNKTELKAIKQRLILEIDNTQKKIDECSEVCKPIAPENSIGRITRMDAINNKSVVEAALRELTKKMSQLKVMQNKINETDFGVCNKCERKIPFGRLIIRPHSKFCVACAK